MPPKVVKKVGSYPNTMIIISLTAALFLIGFCGMLVLQSKKLVSIIRENIEVRVFLERDITEGRSDSIRVVLSQQDFLKSLEAAGTNAITFVSKDEAAKQFIAESNEDFVSFLGENPLRDSYKVRVPEEYFEEEKLKQIKQKLETIEGIHEVVYQERLADDINRNITKIYLILSSFAVIMLIIIVLLTNNTIKLAIYSQRFLIRSMQLVGATNGFIQAPFIKKGALQGLISGLLACALLVALQQAAVRNIEGLSMLQEYTKFAILLISVLTLGILVGVLSTVQSLHKYLRMTLDDLY
jgi:cell division transport system permease protein